MSDPIEVWHAVANQAQARGRGSYQAPPPARFPGDPGPGKMWYGLIQQQGGAQSYPYDDFAAATGHQPGAVRRYYTGASDQPAQMKIDATADIAAGRMPVVSFRCPQDTATQGANVGWAETANGTNDAWLNSIAAAAAAVPGPIWICLSHEPHGRKGGTQDDFRNMYAHAYSILKSGGSNNVTVIPILNGLSWNPAYHDNPQGWAPDHAYVDVLGVDYYNQWWTYSSTGGTGLDGSAQGYRTWQTVDYVFGPLASIASWGYVPAHTEHGVKFMWNPADAGKSAQWILDAYQMAYSIGAAMLSYFNSGFASVQNDPRGPWVLNQYYKAPDWASGLFTDTSRQDAWITNHLRPETALLPGRGK